MKTRLKPILSCFILLLLQTITLQAAPAGIAAGEYHSLLVESDGSLWMFGDNLNGELGDGTVSNRYAPEQIFSGGITTVAGGFDYSLFLKSDGSLWAMGNGTDGQIGNGKNSNVHTPLEIVSNNVTAISTEGATSLFLKSDGSLWGMGYNIDGELGDGRNSSTNLPEQIVSSGVVAIAAGGFHSLFLKSDGSLWGMGKNSNGQLGVGTTISTNLPEQIVPNGVVAIAAGNYHSLFLKSDGSLWAMGYNSNGQLGDGTTTQTNLPEQIVASNVVAIAAGYLHSLFLKSDGSLWAMGYNSNGQLGDGTTVNTSLPEQIVSNGVVMIAAGGYHSLFTKSDGSLWSMGYNAFGELGDGTFTERHSPTHIIFAQLTATPLIGVTPLSVQFTASGTDNEGNAITNWNWTFGDGSVSTAQNPTHIYLTNGVFVPTFRATNSNGAFVPAIVQSIAAASYSGLVLNGNFESGSLYGWSLSGNPKGIAAVSALSAPVHSGKYGADCKPAGSLGFLSQNLATAAGARYILSYWVSAALGPATNKIRVSWDGIVLVDKTNSPVIPVLQTNVVTASGTSTILQFGFQSDQGDYYLDDVSVVPAVLPQSKITSFSLTDTNLVMHANSGLTGEICYTLMSTNVGLPVSQWTPVATNVLGAAGNFTITATNAVDPGAMQRYYILQLK